MYGSPGFQNQTPNNNNNNNLNSSSNSFSNPGSNNNSQPSSNYSSQNIPNTNLYAFGADSLSRANSTANLPNPSFPQSNANANLPLRTMSQMLQIGSLRERLTTTTISILEKCKAIELYFAMRKADTKEDLRDLLEVLPLLLSHIFAGDGETQDSWMDSANNEVTFETGMTIVELLSPRSELFRTILKLSNDSSVSYLFPIGRLPSFYRKHLANFETQYLSDFLKKRMRTHTRNQKQVIEFNLDILEYYFCWFAYYSVNARSRPNKLIQTSNNGSRFTLNLFSKQNENQQKPSSGHPSPTPFDLLALDMGMRDSHLVLLELYLNYFVTGPTYSKETQSFLCIMSEFLWRQNDVDEQQQKSFSFDMGGYSSGNFPGGLRSSYQPSNYWENDTSMQVVTTERMCVTSEHILKHMFVYLDSNFGNNMIRFIPSGGTMSLVEEKGRAQTSSSLLEAFQKPLFAFLRRSFSNINDERTLLALVDVWLVYIEPWRIQIEAQKHFSLQKESSTTGSGVIGDRSGDRSGSGSNVSNSNQGGATTSSPGGSNVSKSPSHTSSLMPISDDSIFPKWKVYVELNVLYYTVLLVEFIRSLLRFPGTSDLTVLQKITLVYTMNLKTLLLQVDFILQTMTTAPNQVIEVERATQILTRCVYLAGVGGSVGTNPKLQYKALRSSDHQSLVISLIRRLQMKYEDTPPSSSGSQSGVMGFLFSASELSKSPSNSANQLRPERVLTEANQKAASKQSNGNNEAILKPETAYDAKLRMRKLTEEGKRQIKEGRRIFSPVDTEESLEKPLQWNENGWLAVRLFHATNKINEIPFLRKSKIRVNLRPLANYKNLVVFVLIVCFFLWFISFFLFGTRRR